MYLRLFMSSSHLPTQYVVVTSLHCTVVLPVFEISMNGIIEYVSLLLLFLSPKFRSSCMPVISRGRVIVKFLLHRLLP